MIPIGPRERAVRDGLAKRPAAVIDGASKEASDCFAGLFNGALRTGHIGPNDDLFIGKSECERGWRASWGELRDLGLVEWSTEQSFRTDGVPLEGRQELRWRITEKGWGVRDDDVKYFHEIIGASRDDRMAVDAPPTPRTGGAGAPR